MLARPDLVSRVGYHPIGVRLVADPAMSVAEYSPQVNRASEVFDGQIGYYANELLLGP